MSKNYKNTMDKITVDDEMKKRILKNISNSNEKNISSRNIKKNYRGMGILAAAACFSIIVSTVSVRLNLNNSINKPLDKSAEISSNQTEDTIQTKDKIDEGSNANNINLSEYENNEVEVNTELNDKNSSEKTKDNYDNNSVSDVALSDDKTNEISSNIKEKVSQVSTEENTKPKVKESTKEDIKNDSQPKVQAVYNINNDRDTRIKSTESNYSLEKNFNTLEELNSSIDFSIKTPKQVVENKDIKNISLKENNNILINYENSNVKLEFKVSKENLEKDDINDSKYNMKKELNINNKVVSIKGNDEIVNNVKWSDDDLSYSINSDDGISADNTIKIIESIK